MEYSCGVIAYKYEQGVLKVMLTHPGGPFWFGTDLGSWGIPKGHKRLLRTSLQKLGHWSFNEHIPR